MPATRVTLLIEDLRGLAGAVDGSLRYPSLERIWSRGQVCRLAAPSPDHLRFQLFGMEAEDQLPVAALTHINDASPDSAEQYYWLRVDPVTMWADMAQVVMASYGFADLDPVERDEVELCVRDVLQLEGIDLRVNHPERWCIALRQPLDFSFTPLNDALGADVADTLPDHPEARFWRRILNEIQIALHHCPVNVRRRAQGLQEINSVWFWGGGFLPDPAPACGPETVYADGAVSRGLAILGDCRIRPLAAIADSDLRQDGGTVLIDWGRRTQDAASQLAELEALSGELARAVDRARCELRLYEGGGEGRGYDRSRRRRFWRRSRPLREALAGRGRE